MPRETNMQLKFCGATIRNLFPNPQLSFYGTSTNIQKYANLIFFGASGNNAEESILQYQIL